tara:strand:+ start:1620 stop:2711 length:1092 start_codon:yes stop_codon:yes gene_type:complete
MSIRKIYNVIGIMSGTSMDGMDFSYVKTDGKNFVKIITEKSYRYSNKYRNKLIKINKNYQKKGLTKFDEDIVTKEFIKLIKRFLKEKKIKKKLVDFIGLSGQTIYHDPKNKKSIQLGSCKIIKEKLNINIVGQFRQNDINNGGQGAPIGAFYHKYIIDNFLENSAILNIGGISNLTFIKKKLIAFDVGPGNCIIDDICMKYFKKNYDKNGKIAFKGKTNHKIIKLFEKDIYFKKKYPKSLDRDYFSRYLNILNNIKKNDSVNTAANMTIKSIIIAIKKFNIKINKLILTGGGRKNLYIFKNLKKILKKDKIDVQLVEKINFNGDMLESQAFAYIAVRSYLKLPLSIPTTTGVKKPSIGGKVYK